MRFRNQAAIWLLKSRSLDAEVQLRMMRSLLRKRGVVIIGHANVVVIACTIFFMCGELWSIYWLCAEAALLVWRMLLYAKVDPEGSDNDPQNYPSIVLSGILWSTNLGIGSALAVTTQNPSAIILVGMNLAGIIGGISSRNGATPRYAIALISLSGFPFCAAALLSHQSWLVLTSIQMFALMGGITVVTIENFKVATALQEAEIKNRHLSETDALTGLRNRAYLARALKELLEKSTTAPTDLSMLFLDLDGFKAVNDRLGHLGGDALLCEVAARLKRCAVDVAHVYRTGGDEFVVTATGIGAAMTNTLASSILTAINRPFQIDGEDAQVGVSIGSVQVDAVRYDIRSLLKQGDDALYAAKRAGKHQHVRRKYTSVSVR